MEGELFAHRFNIHIVQFSICTLRRFPSDPADFIGGKLIFHEILEIKPALILQFLFVVFMEFIFRYRERAFARETQ